MPAAARPNKWLITISVTFGTLMGAIDSSVVNVAIPHIRGAVGASVDEITWVSTGYIIATVLVMPVVAWLGRRLGRKNVYQACMVLFVLSSAFCGLARSLGSLVFFRILQGAGAGGLQPTEQAILRETFPLEEQATAMSVFGLAVMIGPALGPTLGGWIVDNYSWPWIFYVNVPVGAVGLILVQRFVHDPEFLVEGRAAARREAIDYLGLLLLSVGLGALQLLLERGDQDDWFASHTIQALAVVAFFTLAAFVIHELTTEHPIVDLSVLKDKTFAAGTFIGGVLGLALFGSIFMLPLFFQDLRGLTAEQSGIELMPRTLMMVVMMPIAGYLFNRLGARILVVLGLGVGGWAAWSMKGFTLDSSMWDMVLPQAIQGAAFSFTFVALSTAALAHVPREKMSQATGLYNLVRNIGASIGTAMVAVFFERSQAYARADLVRHLSPTRPLVQERLHGIIALLAGKFGHASPQTALRLLDAMLSRQVALLSFERTFAFVGLAFLVSIPLVVLLENVKPSRGSRVVLEAE